MRELCGTNGKTSKHKDLTPSRIKRDSDDVGHIVSIFTEQTGINPFTADSDCLLNIVTGSYSLLSDIGVSILEILYLATTHVC